MRYTDSQGRGHRGFRPDPLRYHAGQAMLGPRLTPSQARDNLGSTGKNIQWWTLTAEEKQTWHDTATGMEWTQPDGSQKPVSGHALYTEYHRGRHHAQVPNLTTAPASLGSKPPFTIDAVRVSLTGGPEGNFDMRMTLSPYGGPLEQIVYVRANLLAYGGINPARNWSIMYQTIDIQGEDANDVFAWRGTENQTACAAEFQNKFKLPRTGQVLSFKSVLIEWPDKDAADNATFDPWPYQIAYAHAVVQP